MTAPVGPPALLDVRAACARVAAVATRVRIDGDALTALAAGLLRAPEPPPWGDPHLTAAECGAAAAAGFTLALSALNFRFWEDPPRWRVDGHDGYMALAHALRRAHDAGVPVADAAAVADWSVDDLAATLRGDPGGPTAPPMLAERHAVLVDTARWLVAAHHGSALRALEAAPSAFEFSSALATTLPRWRDVADYRGMRVPLLKRAQIAVHDCVRALGDAAPAPLRDLDGLTAFADYKVPQVLRHAGVLVYDAALASAVDARRELTAGGDEEVEIRALTVVAVDRLAAALTGSGRRVCAAEVDAMLWWRAQSEAGMAPYHRTRTIWY